MHQGRTEESVIIRVCPQLAVQHPEQSEQHFAHNKSSGHSLSRSSDCGARLRHAPVNVCRHVSTAGSERGFQAPADEMQ